MQALIFMDYFATYSWIFLHSLYFENVLQEYACTGLGWLVRPKRICLVQGWVGGSKMAILGCTYFMDGPQEKLLHKHRDQKRADFIEERNQVETEALEHHEVIASQVSLVSNTDLKVCWAKFCRSLFIPGEQRRQCHVKDCPSLLDSCGCSMEKCETCRVNICHRHKEEHIECHKTKENRCGYECHELLPDCCGKILGEGRGLCYSYRGEWFKCFACKVRVCESCQTKCDYCRQSRCLRCAKAYTGWYREKCCYKSTFYESKENI